MHSEFGLVSAGSTISNAYEHIRRYCGLTDPLGTRQVWGYEFFDARPSPAQDEITAEDVAATAALNMRFTRESLEGFWGARDVVRDGLGSIPSDVSLEDASDELLQTIEDLIVGLCDGEGPFAFKIPGAGRAQVSKVLHRKRPRLIPLYDRVISERYAFGKAEKKFGRGIDLLFSLRDDLCLDANAVALRSIQSSLSVELDGRIVPSRLRLLDIAIWMEGMPSTNR
jgi:hypothetical protein